MANNVRWLDRKAAAAWCEGRGFRHITAVHLRDLANGGKGPPYSRMGKYVYYRETDLAAWLADAVVPVTRCRGQAVIRLQPKGRVEADAGG
ncbi:hypothetical protein [Falsiroseomonas selenitidurans]|uniref:Helix-turn-helix domain-containing protein n=1 Tax=Falsiroseomonas selenitidurans TaxID=2716335 RepID=A0ABX1DZ32_9PROT|nr:hypothetical protein [Falsiroseomonas selenitidurans]NKC30169.1 hypothetical protein [Falsiroseomonas selenitidurans]